MNELAARLSELTKSIKAPRYFILGLVILFITLVFLPILKLLAMILGVVFILISFFPEHDISKKIIQFIDKLK